MSFLSVFNITNSNSLNTLITATIPLVIGFLFHYLLFKVLLKVLSKRNKEEFLVNIRKFRIPSLILIILVALKISSTVMGPNVATKVYIDHILNVLLIFSLAWLVMQFVAYGKSKILGNYDFDGKDNLDARRIYTQFKIIERIVNFLIIALAIALALMTFDSIRKLGISLLASAGVAGIIVGFAAQKLLATILAGLQIAIAQPIRLDDVVVIENEWGWIEEITLTYVVVRIWDKRRLIVPTTYFIEKPFQNWTRTSADILGTVYIYADYTIPFAEIRKELTKILEKDDNWDGKVNVLQVTNATENTVEIRALVSAADSPSAWNLRVNVREKLIYYLQKNYPESLPKTRVVLDN